MPTSRRLRVLIARTLLLSFYLGLFPWPSGFRPAPAEAKVSPLHSITRQVKKGNMLVVLDTSGSMTGVPGEPFDAATELGVDCDLGDDCREVTQTGQCVNSKQPLTNLPRLCSNDAQCRVGQCKFGSDPCLQDFDCPTVGSVCSKDGKPCQYNSDCSPQMSTCKVTSAACSSVQPCQPAGRCSDTNAVCNNPPGSCPTRFCSNNPTLACSADSDCQAGATPPTPPTTGLLVHWKFDEASGATVIDHAGGDHTGTFVNAVQRDMGVGSSGSSVACEDGANTTRVKTDNLQLGNSMTFATWYYPKSLNHNDILIQWGTQSNLFSWGDGKWGFQPDGNLNNRVTTTTLPQVNAWNHLAATWNGTEVRLYLNGALVKTQAVSTTVSTETKSLTACSAGPTNYFHFTHGRLDEVRIYNTALTGPEIQVIHQASSSLAGGGPVIHLTFDDTAADQSGNGFNGMLEGGATYVAGPRGKAIRLNGTDGCVSIPAPQGSAADISGPFSVSSFVYRETAAKQNFVFKKHPIGWNPSIGITFESANYLFTWFRDKPYAWGSGVEQAISVGQWHHVVTIWDGTDMRYYRDGILVHTELGPHDATPWSTGHSWLLGCSSHGDTHREGWSQIRIDDFQVYDRAIGAQEVTALASGGTPAAGGDLLGHWKFDEGTGVTVADQSPYGNPVQLFCTDASNANANQTGAGCSGNGLPSWQQGHTANASDKSVIYSFYEFGELPASVINGKVTNQLTVAMWLKKTLNNSDRWAFHQASDDINGDAVGIGVHSSGRLRFSVGEFATSAEEPTALPLNTWHHVVGTYDGTAVKLYRNGTLVGTGNFPGITLPANTRPITVGAGRDNGKPNAYFDGDVSDLAIWNRVLTTTEITSLQAGTIPPPTGGGAFCKPNSCVAQDNSCNVESNTCQGGQVNQCMGISSTDTCVINQSNAGPAKMCRFEQTFCAVDAHCGAYPGDECVPATSRSVVAKRVLRNVLLNNADTMNFGLMGFSQGGPDGSTWDRNGDNKVDAADKDNWPDDYYFPYYPVKNSTATYETQDRYITLNELATYGCYSPFGGPSGSCTIGSITYQLRPNINARYSVFKNGSFVELDQPYCGYQCVITTIPQGWLLFGDKDDDDDDSKKKNKKKYHDARGTGRFRGAHYTFTVAKGTYETFDQPIFLKQFEGRHTTISGNPYTYFRPRNDYYWNPMAGTNRPPIKGPQCGNQCSVTCGGNWDPNLIPIMDTSDNPAQAKANLEKMLPMLEKAEDGGFMHWERGPVGCALINDFLDGPLPAPNDKKKHSAWHYMEDIKAGDALVCRDNFILLITDGETNGPGDVDAAGQTTCANLDCRVQWDDPNATVGATCQCKSVINALKLRKAVAQGGLNVKTYVIGFSPDAVIGVPATINESIARAGGTCRAPGDPATTADDKCMFLATNETELQESIQAVIFDAIKGSYSTTPASAVSGIQTEEDEITPGGILFDARVDFPTWRGHLIAYDTQDIDAGTGQPKLMWDAGGPQFFPDPNDVLAYKNWTKWKQRRIYTSAGANMISFQVDPNTGKILNRDELFALGLGNTEDEAERIAQWMLGDPKQRNKAVLGAFINSTPIELGPPGLSGLPGGKKFHEQQKDRTSLVYAAADDGLLHAFFTRDTTVGGVAYKGGQEAFAYIPPDMLRMVTNLYTQGGQKADPREHVYGLTSSPKVKNVCWTNCNDDETAQWKTIMIMTDGWGGEEAFMLDLTSPFAGNNFANPPVKVLWHTDTVTPGDKTQYDAFLGSTVSVPAFYFGKGANKNDHRVIFASGYKTDPATSSEQGITLVNASAIDGRLLDSDTINPDGCATVELAALTDVAAARNFDFREQQQMLGAFFGDTWGNLWRYVPGTQGADNNTATTGNLALVKAFGCQSPLHFSPAVVQPDRDDPLNHPGEVYIVQVTNSALDPETEKFQPSRMIIRKEKRTTISGGLAPDNTWIAGGQMELVAGADSMCGVFDPNGGGGGTCSQLIPAHARPTSTPLAILKGDGTGFVVMSLWYAPPLAICGSGRSYLALHDININSHQAVQKAGIALVAEPVTSAVIVGEKVVYTDSQGKVHDVTSQLNQTFVAGGAISDTTRNGGLRFQQTGWTEVP